MDDNKLFINTTLETKANDDDTVDFVASKNVEDRDGDIVAVKGIDLKNFKRNPVILFGHDHHSFPIGKAISIRKSGDELRAKIQFAVEENPQAEIVSKLVKGGYLNATSIGFLADYNSIDYEEVKGKRVRTIGKSELLEISIVPVPANQEALRAGKGMFSKAIEDGVITKEEVDTLETPDEYKELKEQIKELQERIKELEDTEEPTIYDEILNDLERTSELDSLLNRIEEDNNHVEELLDSLGD